MSNTPSPRIARHHILRAAACAAGAALLLSASGCASFRAQAAAAASARAAETGKASTAAAPASVPTAGATSGDRLSHAVAVTGDVGTPRLLDVAALQRLPASIITIGPDTWTGPSLWTVLGLASVQTDPRMRDGSLAMYVVATSADGYRVVLSMPELDPRFGNRAVILAYRHNGQGLGTTGEIRLIVAGDVRMGRSVQNLASISVHTAAR